MSRDLDGDRSGFAAARHAFVTKAKPTGTPERLRFDPGSRAPDERRSVPLSRSRTGGAPAVRPAVPISA
jgi:putative two-component system hydrogenase maturation factor HypX/HoxX